MMVPTEAVGITAAASMVSFEKLPPGVRWMKSSSVTLLDSRHYPCLNVQHPLRVSGLHRSSSYQDFGGLSLPSCVANPSTSSHSRGRARAQLNATCQDPIDSARRLVHVSGCHIRVAGPEDVPHIERLVLGLAEYVDMLDYCQLTREKLQESMFGGNHRPFKGPTAILLEVSECGSPNTDPSFTSSSTPNSPNTDPSFTSSSTPNSPTTDPSFTSSTPNSPTIDPSLTSSSTPCSPIMDPSLTPSDPANEVWHPVSPKLSAIADSQPQQNAAVGHTAIITDEDADAYVSTVDPIRTVVGVAIVYPTFSTFLATSNLYLEDLFIRPPYRSLGMGQLMLQYVCGAAIKQGMQRVDWQVLPHNEAAIKFYTNKIGARLLDYLSVRVEGDALKRAAGGEE